MKEKAIMIIIGILIGAIVTTGVFLIIRKNEKSTRFNGTGQMRNFDRSNLPEGFDPANLPEGMQPKGDGVYQSEDGKRTIITNPAQ